MNDESKVRREHGRSVITLARATRATRARIVSKARAQRRRGRLLRDQALAARERNLDLSWQLWSLLALPEPPSTIPLSWEDFPRAADELLEEALTAAEECAEACRRAIPDGDLETRGTLAAVAAVCSLAAEHGRALDFDTPIALGLCIRVIEANTGDLDRAGRNPGGVLAASAARRCAQVFERALVACYLEAGD